MPIDEISPDIPKTSVYKNASGNNAAPGTKNKPGQLSEDQKREVQELAKRDREVRAHEAAHQAAGGQYVKGGATYQYQKGPDGRMYAVGGEVSIDTSPVRDDPRATIIKMQTIQRAANAPSQPSGQDRAVAAAASSAEAQARQELAQKSVTGEDNDNAGKSTENSNQTPRISSYDRKGQAMPFHKQAASSIISFIA